MSLGSRTARHDTEASRRHAVVSEQYYDFQPNQRVITLDGIPGIVTAVWDGPVPGNEEYEVTLDRGMGGGAYTASQLTATEQTTASEHRQANQDYPELGTILSDRPDPAREG